MTEYNEYITQQYSILLATVLLTLVNHSKINPHTVPFFFSSQVQEQPFHTETFNSK